MLMEPKEVIIDAASVLPTYIELSKWYEEKDSTRIGTAIGNCDVILHYVSKLEKELVARLQRLIP